MPSFFKKYKFDRPVALHFWRPIEDELRRLKEDIIENYQDLAGATASAHTGTVKWAGCITSALERATSVAHDNLFERAKYIRVCLNDALQDLDRRFAIQEPEAPGEYTYNTNPTYADLAKKKLTLKTKILECQKVVGEYCAYCTAIEAYVHGVYKWESCELGLYLQNKFSKQTACSICKELGAITVEHLGCMGVSIETSKFADVNVAATPYVSGVHESLLELRACLEACECEE
jgi:hypothetical protein